ncbi:hypothetical protein GCM10010168_40640 [Actinoplanes ianthinogenes]|uniref:Uncharacterized protein n=1 Tax=Actinoplanes ianthinogenes TaxID=122358 RepID=A0ABM7LWH0_9ACTN|nr:hypothetical protein Aiant_42850 [Actinoplanes ianthinogenes]GGR18763.1 hypothetical protein GCM10010168_40640 [Actinoplanes ianthinogenes]
MPPETLVAAEPVAAVRSETSVNSLWTTVWAVCGEPQSFAENAARVGVGVGFRRRSSCRFEGLSGPLGAVTGDEVGRPGASDSGGAGAPVDGLAADGGDRGYPQGVA